MRQLIGAPTRHRFTRATASCATFFPGANLVDRFQPSEPDPHTARLDTSVVPIKDRSDNTL